MNKDIVIKWAEALESEKYDQGHNSLHPDESFCCLGVLCELYIDAHPGARWGRHRFFFDEHGVFFDELHLPLPVRKWSDLDDAGLIKRLVTMNDRDLNNFKEIAAFIRSTLTSSVEPQPSGPTSHPDAG